MKIIITEKVSNEIREIKMADTAKGTSFLIKKAYNALYSLNHKVIRPIVTISTEKRVIETNSLRTVDNIINQLY